MVSTLSLVCMIISAILIFLLPLGLVVYLYRTAKISLLAVGAGCLVFTVFQFLIRIPLLVILNGNPQFQQLMQNLFFSGVIIGGLTAGLFEETGRFLAFRYLLKKEDLSWKNGVAYGLGHGGIEAIGLAGFICLSNIAVSLSINNGSFAQLIGAELDAATAEQIKNQLINTPSTAFLLSGLERVFAIIIQVGLSLLVLSGVRNGKLRCLLYAILLHTLVNASSVLMTNLGVKIWLVETYICFLAILALFWIYRARPLLTQTSASGSEEGVTGEETVEGKG